MTTFSDWLTSQLASKNMSPAELARRMKKDQGIISRLLRGERNPSNATLSAIAKALDVPIEIVLEAAGVFIPTYKKEDEDRIPTLLYWRCSSQKKGHVYISDAEVLPLVVDAIVYAVRHVDDLKLPSPEDKRPALEAELREQETRRKRWLDLFEVGSIEAADFTDRVHVLDERIAAIRRQIADIEGGINNLEATRAAVNNLAQAVDQLPHYLLTQPPALVNSELLGLFEQITITRDRKVILGWRV